MNVGMLWLDGDGGKNIGARIARAADYYRSKYGVAPTTCFIHPSMLSAEVLGLPADLRLRTSKSILRHHIWVGVEERPAA